MKLAIVDYGMGNIHSLSSALKFIGVNETILANDHDTLAKADKIILPGVGNFAMAAAKIHKLELDVILNDVVIENKKPILGVCLGMQLLGSSSEEDGLTKGLSFFQRKVEPFHFKATSNTKVPHIGFNSVRSDEESKLFQNIDKDSDFYFVHSYRMEVDTTDNGHGTCFYGEEFLASFELDNVFGTQFHPEKSQTNGIQLLRNFLEI